MIVYCKLSISQIHGNNELGHGKGEIWHFHRFGKLGVCFIHQYTHQLLLAELEKRQLQMMSFGKDHLE